MLARATQKQHAIIVGNYMLDSGIQDDMGDGIDSDGTIRELDLHSNCQFCTIDGGQDTDTEDEDSTSVTQQSLPRNRLRRTYAVEDVSASGTKSLKTLHVESIIKLSKVFTETRSRAADSHEPPTRKSNGDKLN